MIRNLKGSAKKRNLEFNLDYTDITLPKYCPILEFELNYSKNIKYAINTPTIDRIDNSKGYIKGNIIVISRLANAMKNEADFNQLNLFSKNILKVINYYENQGARGNITDIFFKNEELNLDS
jgi:cupin superfamily acireductone dioxygenase involved in methionine salvage